MTCLAPSLALLALATPSALAPADVIEVAAPTGDPDLDRASIVEALGRAEPGDTVQFAGGTYEVGAIVRVVTPDLTLLGHADGTTLRGGDFEVGDPLGDDPGSVDALGILHLFEGGSTVRGLGFEDSFWGLVLGWNFGLAWDDRMPEVHGGFLIEDNRFENTNFGVRWVSRDGARSLVRRNRFVDVFFGVNGLGGNVVIAGNRFDRSEDAGGEGRSEAITVGAERIVEGCSDIVVEGNSIEGFDVGIAFYADGSRLGERDVVRGNSIDLRGEEGSIGIELMRRPERGADLPPDGGVIAAHIEGNRVVGADAAGVAVLTGCDDARIVNNVFEGLSGPAVLLGGNRARVTGQRADAGIRHMTSAPPRAAAGLDVAAADAAGLDHAALTRLSGRIGGWVRSGDLVGAELLVIQDGAVRLHDAYGWSDREEKRPMRRGTIHRIRSMTKPFIGTAALLLASEGALDLDDPIGEHLAPLAGTSAGRITVGQLLTHRGGLGGLGDLVDALRATGIEHGRFESLDDVVAAVAAAGPTERPGQYRYSDVGSACLAAVVASAAGAPAERFIEDRVLEPLGLADTHTAYSTDAAWRPRVASTYRWDPDARKFERYWDPGQEQEARFFRGAGGMYATAMDIGLFAQAWLDWTDGDGLLPREVARRALRPHAQRSPTEGYGHQWTVSRASAEGLPRLFGHGGSDGTRVWVFPEARAIVVFMSQSRGHSMRDEFVAAMAEELPEASFLLDQARREAEVRATIDAFIAALSDLDLRGLGEHFAPDASVFFPLRGESLRADGWTAIEAVFAPTFETWRGELDGPPYLTIQPRDVRIQWVAGGALVTFHVAESSRRTLLLERRDGAWRVVHLHGSSVGD